MNNYIPPVTKNILILNTILFVLKMILPLDLDVILGAFYPQSPNFHIYQVVTHMFMHGEVMHFFFNMYAVYMFGSMIEQSIGAKKYIILYFTAGIGAFILFNLVNFFEMSTLLTKIQAQNLDISNIGEYTKLNYTQSWQVTGQENLHSWLDTFQNLNQEQINLLDSFYWQLIIPMVGASGAIFGVLVVFAVLYPDLKMMLLFIPFPIKAKYFISFYILVELFLGIKNSQGDNIAHFAHLGGALFGYILIKYLDEKTISK